MEAGSYPDYTDNKGRMNLGHLTYPLHHRHLIICSRFKKPSSDICVTNVL